MNSVFIHEFRYDNDGTDTGEFVELAGLAGTDLTGWSLVLCNGANGLAYSTTGLTGQTLSNQSNGFGFVLLNYPSKTVFKTAHQTALH